MTHQILVNGQHVGFVTANDKFEALSIATSFGLVGDADLSEIEVQEISEETL